jgi:Flp pilus assembly protein TadG
MYPRKNLRRGAAAVEFAIVAPVFFLLALGLVEVGRMVMLQHALTNAAREGCRAAGLASSINPEAVDTKVRTYLCSVVSTTALDATKVRVTAPETLAEVPSGTDMVVSIELSYADATWLPLHLLRLNPTLVAEARRKRE